MRLRLENPLWSRAIGRYVTFVFVLATTAVLIVPSFLGSGSATGRDLLSGELLAQESNPDRKNCPIGFFWERLSGQCCVQDRGTLPANGKIGYTGNSLCEDGYVGAYEQRPTTDGQGPPGCPNYTSYAFLVSCTSSGETPAVDPGIDDNPARVVDGDTQPAGTTVGPVGDLADLAATQTTKPTPGLLATLGLAAVGVAGLTRWGVTTLGAPLLGFSELDRARSIRDIEALKRFQKSAELARAERRHTLVQIDRRIKAAYERLMRSTDPSKWRFDEYNEIVNAVATVGSIALTGGWAAAAAAIWAASTALSGASTIGGTDADGRSSADVTSNARDLTNQLMALRGTIAGALSSLESEGCQSTLVPNEAWLDALSKIDPSAVSESERNELYQAAKNEVVHLHKIGAGLEMQIVKTEQELFKSKAHRDSLRTLFDVSGEQDIEIDSDKNFTVAVVTGIAAGNPKSPQLFDRLPYVLKLTPGALKLAKAGSLGTTALSLFDAYSKASASQQKELLRQAVHGHEYQTAMLQEQLNQLKPRLESARAAEAKALTIRQNAWKAAK